MKTKVLDIKQLTPLSYHIILAGPLEFIPGQFVSIILPGTQARRPYSIVMNSGRNIELCVKKVGEASSYLCSLKPGDEVEYVGPYGRFLLATKPEDSVFISVGVGIAPFRAMIPVLLSRKKHVWLLAGYRKEADLLYHDEFSKYQSVHKNFKYAVCMSQPEGATFPKGYVQTLLTAIPQNFQGNYYLCGGKEMVEQTKDVLLKKGVSKEKIFTERFS